jgi:cell division protein FtsB
VSSSLFLKKKEKNSVNLIMMKFGKYLLVPWLIMVVYMILSIYSGPAGIVPYRELLGERQRILENLDKLQTLNRELEGTMGALLYDSETIQIKARELGYGEYGERFIRIVGLPGGRQNELKPGMIRTATHPSPPGRAHRTISLCMGLLLFSFFLAGDLLLTRKPALQ